MSQPAREQFESLVARVAADTSMTPEQRTALLQSLSTVATPLETDKWIYRGVVLVLGTALILTIAGGFWVVIAGLTNNMPEGLIAIGSAAVGALAGLLAPSPGRS